MKTPILLIALVFSALLLAMPALATDCCVTDATCEEGDIPQATCSGLGGTHYAGIPCGTLTTCQDVCCCKKPDTQNADDWNYEASNLVMKGVGCVALGDEYESHKPPEDCVMTCTGSDSQEPPTSYYTISGTITDEEDNPVEGSIVFVPFTFGTLEDTTGENGQYEVADVPNLRGQVIATKENCIPASSPVIDFDENKIVDLQINCNPEACLPEDPDIESLELIKGTAKSRLTLTFDDPCQLWDHFIIKRKEMVDGDVVSAIVYQDVTDVIFEDEDLEPETEYCYEVAAFYNEGYGVLPPEDERAEECIVTGIAECMENDDAEWCDNDPPDGPRVLGCDDNNHEFEVKTCNEGSFCTTLGSGQTERRDCVLKPGCDTCNGLFGVLGTLTNVIFGVIQNYQTFPCNDPALSAYCFDDNSYTAVDGYRACGEVTNCEDYHGGSACSENPCGVPGDCAWRAVMDEVQKGVCQSTTETADCSACKDIYGVCNTELCESIGLLDDGTSDCYYDKYSNGFPTETGRCIHRDDMACRWYDTVEDCVGAREMSIDVIYGTDPQGNPFRTQGTHVIAPTSDDYFGKGVCRWEPVPSFQGGGKCYKDADGITSSPDDDCIENGIIGTVGEDCLVDAEPPETQLVIAAGILGVDELATIEYVVADNLYPASQIETRFCMAPEGESCYPDLSLTDAIIEAVDLNVGESGTFIIRYYSYDLSGNLEPVKEESVTLIERGYPWLQHAEIR